MIVRNDHAKPCGNQPLACERQMIQSDSSQDEGVTLLELMMVIVISSVVGAMVLGSFIAISNITVRMVERAEDQIEAEATADEITTTLRGATVDPANPDAGVFAIATTKEMKFLTRAGVGFSDPPRWVHYRINNDSINRVDAHGKEHVMMSGLNGTLPFRYYTYDPQFNVNKHGNCFLSVHPTDFSNPSIRREIVGMQIQIVRLHKDNVRERRRSHAGEFVYIPEQMALQTLVNNEQLSEWKNTCWESQHLRINPSPRTSTGGP